jgi:hypothetical protein
LVGQLEGPKDLLGRRVGAQWERSQLAHNRIIIRPAFTHGADEVVLVEREIESGQRLFHLVTAGPLRVGRELSHPLAVPASTTSTDRFLTRTSG